MNFSGTVKVAKNIYLFYKRNYIENLLLCFQHHLKALLRFNISNRNLRDS